MEKEEIRKAVRARYGEVAQQGCSCCGGTQVDKLSKKIGYGEEDIASVPEGANLGLGCGNPVALASLKEGEVVLDLGSGAGFDCFLAANKVGQSGRVIGVDMTPEMLEKARGNTRQGGYTNVEFRLGEIENLPVADSSVDIIISNCVINLSPDKSRVFAEAFRVLKPGGRLMVSDIVLLKELPDFIRNSVAAYTRCLAGALMKEDYLRAITEAGFKQVKVVDETFFPINDMANDPTVKTLIDRMKPSQEKLEDVSRSVASVKVQAVKGR